MAVQGASSFTNSTNYHAFDNLQGGHVPSLAAHSSTAKARGKTPSKFDGNNVTLFIGWQVYLHSSKLSKRG